MAFEYSLAEGQRSLFWAFWELGFQKATGLLSVELPTRSGGKEKKEIAFEAGEPVVIRSTRSEDRLIDYMLRQARLTPQQCQEAKEETQKDPVPDQVLVSWLLQRQLLESSALFSLMELFFAERCFDLLTHTRGQIKWSELPEIPQKIKDLETVRLAGPFLEVLWKEVKARYDEAYRSQRLNRLKSSSLRVSGELPIPLSAGELKAWNRLSADAQDWRAADQITQILMLVALERGLVEEAKEDHSGLEAELRSILEKKEPFDIFPAAKETSTASVKKDYLLLVKKYHPDRLPTTAEASLRELCEDVISHINEAYSVVSDPQKREEYLAEKELEDMGGRDFVEAKIKAEFEYEDLRRAIQRKQYEAVVPRLKELQKYLEEDPQFQADLLFSEAMLHCAQSKPKEALTPLLSQLTALRKKNESMASLAYYEGVLFKLTGQNDKALRSFSDVLELQPHHAEAAMELRLLQVRSDKKGRSWFKKGDS